MFNKLKLILLFVCIFGFINTEAKLSGKWIFKRGVVVGDDQYIKGHINSGRHEDIIVGGHGRGTIGGGGGGGAGYNPDYSRPAYSPGAGAGAGAGSGAGVGAGVQYNRNSGYNRYKRATTIIKSPNGVYIGTGNTFGDDRPSSGSHSYAGVGAGAHAGAGAGIGAGRPGGYSQAPTHVPANNPGYSGGSGAGRQGGYSPTGNNAPAHNTGYGGGAGSGSGYGGSNRGSSAGTQYGSGYQDNEHGRHTTSGGYTVKPASGHHTGLEIGDRNYIEGSIKAH